MRLAIADPPYLGRGARWYGGGRGHFKGDVIAADVHPDAAEWDDPLRHVELVETLMRDFDGWVLAGAPDSLGVYLAACPPDVRVMVWHRANAMPSGSRLTCNWEFVLAYLPATRRGRGTAAHVGDVLTAGVRNQAGFLGSKPASWTRWVLEVLGYEPDTDELHDLFPGSGAVSAAADGMLAFAGEHRDLNPEPRGSGT